MLLELAGPAMPGAVCKNRAPLFDDQLPGEDVGACVMRLLKAQTLCRSCPAFTGCAQRRSDLEERDQWVLGVWAGQIQTTHQPVFNRIPESWLVRTDRRGAEK